MSAAHELIERGYTVRVFERQDAARRQGPQRVRRRDGHGRTEGPAGRARLPLLPAASIATSSTRWTGSRSRAVTRRPTTSCRRAETRSPINGRTSIVMSAWFPRSIADVRVMLAERVEIEKLGLTDEDESVFAARVWQLMTSCRERSLQEYERLPWVTYLGAEQRSEAFRKILVGGLTRSLIAATPKEASTDVGGTVLTELFYALSRPGTSADRLLNGPTNDVWLTPWLAWLRSRGVDYHLDAEVTAIDVKDRQIAGVTVREGGVESTVTRRLLHRCGPGRADGPARDEGDDRCRSHPGRDQGPRGRHALDDGSPVLPVAAGADRGRARHLHRDAVGAHVDLAGPVLDRLRPRGLRRRHGPGHPVGGHLRLGRARRPHDPQARPRAPARGDPGRGLGSAQGRDQQPRRGDPDRRHETRLVPRSRHLVGRHRGPGRHPRRRAWMSTPSRSS